MRLSRSGNTYLTYKNAIKAFLSVLVENHIDIDKTEINELSEDAIILFSSFLKNSAATTESLYLTAAKAFYEFIAAENMGNINLPRIELLIKQRSRRPGKRLPQFPADAIESLIAYFGNQDSSHVDDETARLILLRDIAFIITLADTGLRVHEACGLRRGDIDWNEGKALVIGKGNRQAVVRFSIRSETAMRNYLQARARLDGTSGKPLGSLPVFARHDKGSGKKVKPITPTTGRLIIAKRVNEALGPEYVGSITPHSFRHFFVTRVLSATGNLKLAQSLARHQNIAVTQRYAHLSDDELDKGYHQVFEE